MRIHRARKNADPATAPPPEAADPADEQPLAVEHPSPPPSPAPQAAASGEDDDDEEEGEEEEGEEEEEEAPPKLAEGFYEIEAIRKKRSRKGQLQYLVKWRDWPETANTWEPVANLDACADMIEVFEERQKTPKSSRKRRRRSTGPPSTSKKTRQAVVHVDTEDDEEKPADGSPEEADKEEVRTAEPDVEGGKITIELPQEEDGGTMDGSSKVEGGVGGGFRGARKRKSGSVRRFKQDQTMAVVKFERNGREKPAGNEDVDSTEEETVEKVAAAEDVAGEGYSITKIIMPVRFVTKVTNDVQEVSITFKAMRSDGKEVLVDDKQLKANNPLLLIGYYEQHLRYSPLA